MRWLLLGVIIACSTMGDVLNTAGMKRWGELDEISPVALGHMLLGIFGNPLVLAGLGALAVSFFALLGLLSIANVSFAIPATAASYLFETLLAKYFLKEDVSWRRWVGASLVAVGVVLLSL